MPNAKRPRTTSSSSSAHDTTTLTPYTKLRCESRGITTATVAPSLCTGQNDAGFFVIVGTDITNREKRRRRNHPTLLLMAVKIVTGFDQVPGSGAASGYMTPIVT
ncbi:hypothetical protein Pelo_17293 [Pelomyxa schiedti]|nr:hypothetical protein Pelo_17293 [Pelomyxa schiedti]